MFTSEENTTRLRDLFPAATYSPAGCDPRFASAWSDAALVGPGDVYVHLDEMDSTDAELAVERGAVAVVAERLLPVFGTQQIVVADSHAALQKLTAVRDLPDTSALEQMVEQVVVAGSCGGERTAALLAAIQASTGRPTGLLTEHSEDDGEHCVRRAPGSMPTAWLRRCGLGGVTTAIVQATPELPFTGSTKVLCLTSFRCDGLSADGGRQWESIASHRAALRIAAGLSGFEGTLITNADEPDCLRLAATHPGRLITFGASGEADLHVTPVERDSGGQTFILAYGSDSACVSIPTAGRSARRDAVAAVATAIARGFDLHTASNGLDLVGATHGQLEPVVAGQPFSTLLDYAVRPLEIADALEGARNGPGSLIAVVRLSDDPAVAGEQMQTASRLADRVFAHGDVPHESPNEGGRPENVTVIDDRLAAAAVALGLAEPGDAVVMLGCVEGPRGLADRAVVTKLLRRRLACEDSRAAA